VEEDERCVCAWLLMRMTDADAVKVLSATRSITSESTPQLTDIYSDPPQTTRHTDQCRVLSVYLPAVM